MNSTLPGTNIMSTWLIIGIVVYIVGIVFAGTIEMVNLVLQGDYYKFGAGLFRIIFWPLVVPFIIKEAIKARRDKASIKRVKDVL